MLHAQYYPFLALLLGLTLAAAHLGWGLRVFGFLAVPGLPVLRVAVSLLLGQSAYALAVFALAVAGLASKGALVTLLVAWIGIGVTLLLQHRRALPPLPRFRAGGGIGAAAVALPLSVMGLITAIYALAPATKIDETNYALLVPLRIVQDGALRYYHEPFPAAIVPQMQYQVSQAGFFAMGLPDAGAVVSLVLAIAIFALLAEAVAEATADSGLALVATALFSIGLYTIVNYTTAGSHALMDLSTVTAFGLFYALRRGAEPVPLHLGAIAVAAQAAVAAKISMAPVALLVMLAALVAGRGTLRRSPLKSVAALLLPWMLFCAPWVAWTQRACGAPFGPAFARLVPGHRIPERVLESVDASRAVGHGGIDALAVSMAQHHNLLFWILVGACVVRAVRVRWLLVPVGVAAVQLAAIWILLPHDVRFLGGLQYVLAAAPLVAGDPGGTLRARTRRLLPGVAAAVSCVYLAAIGYYWWPHARVVVGLESRESYLRRYIAFYNDFVELDRRLPADAVLVAGNRLASAYAPRPVVGSFDLLSARPAYTFIGISRPEYEPGFAEYLASPRAKPGAIVYRNDDAILEAYRKPWPPAPRGTLIVRALQRPVAK